jgi:hypothetical protein
MGIFASGYQFSAPQKATPVELIVMQQTLRNI